MTWRGLVLPAVPGREPTTGLRRRADVSLAGRAAWLTAQRRPQVLGRRQRLSSAERPGPLARRDGTLGSGLPMGRTFCLTRLQHV